MGTEIEVVVLWVADFVVDDSPYRNKHNMRSCMLCTCFKKKGYNQNHLGERCQESLAGKTWCGDSSEPPTRGTLGSSSHLEACRPGKKTEAIKFLTVEKQYETVSV